jgi:hypothetical protein
MLHRYAHSERSHVTYPVLKHIHMAGYGYGVVSLYGCIYEKGNKLKIVLWGKRLLYFPDETIVTT